MKKFPPPSHIRTLAKALGCPPCKAQAQVDSLKAAVKPHEIDVTYVTRYRQWWLTGFTSDGPDFGMMKCHGLLAFIDYLHDPNKIIHWFQQRRAESQPALAPAITSALDLFAA